MKVSIFPILVFHQAVARDADTSLIQGNYKLVKTRDKNRLELFNISRDIGEGKDLSTSLPKVTDHLHTLMVDYLNEAGAEPRKLGSKAEAYNNAQPL